uniref:Uncharacterized protein n=1 Tax=Panagrolaimus sp. JU765 TaxID=591449 RepID=A0AC34R222_9BILA
MLFEILTKFQNGLTFENLRRFFYIVSPAETTFEKLEDVPDYLTISQYWFLAFIFVDVLIAKLMGKSVYALNDTITSVNAGILSQLPKYAGRMISIPLYVYIYNNYRLFDLDVHSTWLWFAGFFAQDLAYYLAHRVVHVPQKP